MIVRAVCKALSRWSREASADLGQVTAPRLCRSTAMPRAAHQLWRGYRTPLSLLVFAGSRAPATSADSITATRERERERTRDRAPREGMEGSRKRVREHTPSHVVSQRRSNLVRKTNERTMPKRSRREGERETEGNSTVAAGSPATHARRLRETLYAIQSALQFGSSEDAIMHGASPIRRVATEPTNEFFGHQQK